MWKAPHEWVTWLRLDDFCTIEQALKAYGVVITDSMQVDEPATAARRAEMGKVAAE